VKKIRRNKLGRALSVFERKAGLFQAMGEESPGWDGRRRQCQMTSRDGWRRRSISFGKKSCRAKQDTGKDWERGGGTCAENERQEKAPRRLLRKREDGKASRTMGGKLFWQSKKETGRSHAWPRKPFGVKRYKSRNSKKRGSSGLTCNDQNLRRKRIALERRKGTGAHRPGKRRRKRDFSLDCGGNGLQKEKGGGPPPLAHQHACNTTHPVEGGNALGRGVAGVVVSQGGLL